MTAKQDRLFVLLNAEPYRWFVKGQKRWELRKYNGQFTERNVHPGRRVELRSGYQERPNAPALWGVVRRVVRAGSVREVYEHVPFREVSGAAETLEDALASARERLCIDPERGEVIAFKVVLDGEQVADR